MIINLNEIGQEGKSFYFDNKTAELNSHLSNLVGDQAYEANFFILPIGKSFDISGKIQANLPLICSFCTVEFNFTTTQNIHEIVVIGENKNLAGWSGKWDNESETNLTIIDAQKFNIGDLAYQTIGLAVPNQPVCKEECKGLCHHCGIDLNREKCNCAEQKNKDISPFSVLKGLKLH